MYSTADFEPDILNIMQDMIAFVIESEGECS